MDLQKRAVFRAAATGLLLLSCACRHLDKRERAASSASSPAPGASGYERKPHDGAPPVLAQAADPTLPLPRPIRPLSGTFVRGSSVTFRWAGARAHVELCRTRNCEAVEQHSTESELSEAVLAVPPGIWYWRVVAAEGHASASWGFEAFSGAAGRPSTSSLVGADYNCDGFSDIGLPGSVLFGRKEPLPKEPSLTKLDLGELKIPEFVRDPSDAKLDWSYPQPAGDVDGDGCVDLTVQVSRQATTSNNRSTVRLFYRGGTGATQHWSATSRLSHRAAPIGDINEDGYADVAECASSPGDSNCSIYAGGPNGLRAQPLLVLPRYAAIGGGADADGDGHDDLVGWTNDRGAVLEQWHGTVALYRGPLTKTPSSPDQTWRVPGSVSSAHLADIDADGSIDVWGTTTTTTGSTVEMWWISGAQRRTVKTLATVHRDASDGFTFVAGVGPRARGILAFKTERWPDYAFAQAAYPFQVGSALHSAPRIVSDYFASVLQAVGDFNADGWEDLFVTRATDNNDALGEVYFGGPRWFTIGLPGSPFQPPPFPVSPFD